ncbi:type II secretion system F family protein [Microbacterium fluvii]|uniref:Type II secretion system F family protein n=1 Tax=Microbacterium fluvii TaxID=415215 RepID=A0ABW2HBS6_9MICO|nr:type II secretion system F family protein [Microbacterium fluvii]MCU4672193.1 type II secretion system F family protein [Microbacterium fluvii]
MTLVWGAMLAAGVLLVVSPWVWPRKVRTRARDERADATRALLDAAGLHAAPSGALPAACAGSAALAGAVAWLISPVPVLAGLAALAGGVAPLAWLRVRAARLVRTRRGLWPDVCDLLIASVRAGRSLPDAVADLATSAPDPLREPFVGFARDLAASGHFDSSARTLKGALADPVGDRVIETLRMARQVGGTELTTVLRSLAASVRADAALRAEVDSRQSWTRGAAVLGVAAPWVILALLSTRPEAARAYATAEGVVLIVVSAIVSVVAYRLMVRVGRLPEPRRWFG